MSLESKIEALTVAVTQLTARLDAQAAGPAAPTGPVVAPQTNFVPPAAAVTQSVPAAAPVQQPAPAAAMPGAPFGAPGAAPFAAPPVQQAATAPFNEPNGLIKYATDSYLAMDPSKQPGFGNIIASLGHANVNEIRPDQYAAFYQAVEQLKVS